MNSLLISSLGRQLITSNGQRFNAIKSNAFNHHTTRSKYIDTHGNELISFVISLLDYF